jgi:hypothetical protein
MYNLRVSSTACAPLMLTCAAYMAGGEDSLTILAPPSYLLSRLLVDPSHRGPGLTMFFADLFDFPDRKSSLMFVMSVPVNDFLSGIVLLDWRGDMTRLGGGTIS